MIKLLKANNRQCFFTQEASGFTLLEVLIALVILSLGFAAVFYSINTNTRTLLALEEKTGASWVAANVIAQSQLGLFEGTSEGNQPQLGETYFWTLSRSATQNAQVFKVDVSVSKKQGGTPITKLMAYQLEKKNE